MRGISRWYGTRPFADRFFIAYVLLEASFWTIVLVVTALLV